MSTLNTPNPIRDLVLGDSPRYLLLEQELDLLKARQEMLFPYLDFLPLRELKDFKVSIFGLIYPLPESRCTQRETIRLLHIQGYFQRTRSGVDSASGMLYLFGLNRMYQWVWVEVAFDSRPNAPRTSVIRSFEASSVDLAELLLKPGVSFKLVWEFLSTIVNEWVADRESKLQKAQRVAQRFAADDYFLEPFLKGTAV